MKALSLALYEVPWKRHSKVFRALTNAEDNYLEPSSMATSRVGEFVPATSQHVRSRTSKLWLHCSVEHRRLRRLVAYGPGKKVESRKVNRVEEYFLNKY